MGQKNDDASIGEMSESDFRKLFPNSHPDSAYHGLWKWKYEAAKDFGLSEDLAIGAADMQVLPVRAADIRYKLINNMPKDDPLLLSLLRHIREEVRKAQKGHAEKRRQLYVARDKGGGRPRTKTPEYKAALAFFRAIKKYSAKTQRGLLRTVQADNNAMEKYRELVNLATRHLPSTKREREYRDEQTKAINKAQFACVDEVGSDAWQNMPAKERTKKLVAAMNFDFADPDERFMMREERLPPKNRLSSKLLQRYQGQTSSFKAQKWTNAFLDHAGMISEAGRPSRPE